MSKFNYSCAPVGVKQTLLALGLCVLCAGAVTQTGRCDDPLFHYTPPNNGLTGAIAGVPATPAGTSAAPAPAATTGIPAPTSSVNVLLLALDEDDIAAARTNNITSLVPGADGAPRVPARPVPGERANGVAALGDAPAILPGSYDIPGLPKWNTVAQVIPPLSGTAPEMSPTGADAEGPSRRPPGRSQIMAAPMRRALNAAGFRDVLTTPLDGASILRSVNNGRLSPRTLDVLRFTTGQMLDAARAGADRFTAEGGVVENAPTGAASAGLAQTRQAAVAAASRIALTLGYRAAVVVAVTPADRGGRPGAVVSLLVVDAPRETAQAFLLRQEGGDQTAIDQKAAASAAENISNQLRTWAPFTNTDRAAQVQKYMALAKAAAAKNDLAAAQDLLQLVVAFDPSYADGYILMGDILRNADPAGAATAYQRAAEINTRNGEVWAKMAIVHTMSNPPDWVRCLQAAARAQQLNYDSANLRTAMGGAEFGRADLFRRSGRIEQAEDAELAARRHLERARELAPDSPEVTANVSRLMAKYLLDQKRYKEAVQALELLAIQYPNDLQTQTLYARALEGFGQRDEDTFMTWARVWKLKGDSDVALDSTRYAVLADGFDQRLVTISKTVFQLANGVSTGAIPRETAILQTRRAKEELQVIIDALNLIRPPASRATADAHVNRQFAADLITQAMESYSLYLETGNDLYRTRGIDLHKQSIESLNQARGGGGGAPGGAGAGTMMPGT